MPPDRVATALSRFGLGPRPGAAAPEVAADPREPLLAELEPKRALLDGPDLPTTAEALTALRDLQMARKQAREQPPPQKVSTRAGPPMEQNPSADPAGGMNAPARIYLAEFAARLDRIASAEIGYVERLVAFWANHFTVSAATGQTERILVGAYEREAIRPHVLGTFPDMLFAATRHAAMLTYLNNAVSVGPNSRAGRRSSRGLNENHAREIMELHTIGVDGGYTQADVTALANVLTGWSISRGDKDGLPLGAFMFRAAAHEPGPQTIMGKVYDQPGEAQGRAVIADLAASPATARHIATKLARSFVADDPPPALVERLAADFRTTGGNLLSLSRTLVESDEAWTGPGKFKTPQQFLWSSLRALDLRPRPRQALSALRTLGQLPWNPPSPAGYDDTGAHLARPRRDDQSCRRRRTDGRPGRQRSRSDRTRR